MTRSHGRLWRLWNDLYVALCKLNQIQFDAPWNPRRPNC